MKGIQPVTATDNCRRDLARDLLSDLRQLDRQARENEAQMRDALAASRTTLTSLPGLGTVLVAKVLGHIGDISRFPTEHHFASYTGSAPLDASSGKNVRHRLNTGGNRALNSALHIIARSACRSPVAADRARWLTGRRGFATGQSDGHPLFAGRTRIGRCVVQQVEVPGGVGMRRLLRIRDGACSRAASWPPSSAGDAALPPGGSCLPGAVPGFRHACGLCSYARFAAQSPPAPR